MEENPNYKPGLEGVIAGKTAISRIDGGLSYRGYKIQDLVNASFEEVAHLLLYKKLPTVEKLKNFSQRLGDERYLSRVLLTAVTQFPEDANIIRVLQASISMMGLEANPRETAEESAVKIIAKLPMVLFQINRRHSQKCFLDYDSLYAKDLYLDLVSQEPSPIECAAFEASLILYMDNEFNASTFATRVSASTMTDIYSAISAGIGALKGPLHGGANQEVAKILQELATPESARLWVSHMLAEHQKIMGFGHRVYKEDPRSVILKTYCEKLACRNQHLYDIARAIEDEIKIRKPTISPNIDFHVALLYLLLQIPPRFYVPIFVCSRVVGWCAHFMEQQQENRIIRPRAWYVGEKNCVYQPIKNRR